MIGCPIDRDDVIPAKKRRPNHSAPAIGANHPQLLKSVGSVRNPSANPLPPGRRRLDLRESQVRRRDGDQNRTAEKHLDPFVHPARRRPAESDVLFRFHVGGVAVDAAQSDGEGEEDLSGGGEPRARIEEAFGPRIPQEVEPDQRALNDAGIVRAESQTPDREDHAEKE